MPATDRYEDILGILDPGDRAVVEEVVKDAKEESYQEGKRAAIRRRESVPLWLAAITLVGGSILGFFVSGLLLEGCVVATTGVNEGNRACRDSCLPLAARLVSDAGLSVCECAGVDGDHWDRAPEAVQMWPRKEEAL